VHKSAGNHIKMNSMQRGFAIGGCNPIPGVFAYYRDYGQAFASRLKDYFVPERALWELPLWAAHLSGMLESLRLPMK
jgi:hypothetical protein